MKIAVFVALISWAGSGPPEDPEPAEARALAYLAREVPRWAAENHCYSCHNNGDAARALYVASARAEFAALVPAKALADTTAWLREPKGWDHNGGEGPFSDKRLATFQFALALATAAESGRVADRGPLAAAARRLAALQADDGSFPIDGPDALGTPATYGRPLATALAARTLEIADRAGFAGAIARARGWLDDRPVRNTLDAAAVLVAHHGDDRPACRRAVDWLRTAQGDDGGWGPYADAPPEVFDTAVAVLALDRGPDRPGAAPLLRRGRDYLRSRQLGDGSWPETTRPPGGESYAQRLSTTGWATLALIDARSRERP